MAGKGPEKLHSGKPALRIVVLEVLLNAEFEYGFSVFVRAHAAEGLFDLDVFYLEVESKLGIGFTNHDRVFVRSIILLITNHQFHNTCFTNGRKIGELIHCCCFK